MKKILAGLVSASFILSMLTGCRVADERSYITSSNSQNVESQESVQSSSVENKGVGIAVSSDWKEMMIGIDTVGYIPIFPLSGLTDAGWTFDPAAYGIGDTLTAGIKLSGDIYLSHEGCDDGVLAVEISNVSDKEVPLMENWVCSIKANIKDKVNYPTFSLPGNIQWTASEEDIKTALGEPAESIRDDENKCTELVYSDADVKYVHYYVYDEGGLLTFKMEQS